MKREIKFRAWEKDRKVWRNDVEFFPLKSLWDNPTPELIFMQYTGLKDVNGVEIYEGDILRWRESHGREEITEVKWNPNETGFSPFMEIEGDCDDYYEVHPCEVVGNIYEDKELLK